MLIQQLYLEFWVGGKRNFARRPAGEPVKFDGCGAMMGSGEQKTIGEAIVRVNDTAERNREPVQEKN